MSLHMASQFGMEGLWLPFALIAAWLVLMCMKSIGTEIEHAIRCHNLRAEARALRAKQSQRLKALALKGKR